MVYMDISHDQAIAELPVLREFIDFLNRQVGVYMDCLAGFEGNRVRIERQVVREARPASRKMENGIPVVVWTSLEDPSQPGIIHNRISHSDEYIRENSEAGYNEQQVCWSIIVFVFAYWDEEVRPKIARIRRIEPNDIKIDALGDLRILRKAIIHNGGVLTKAEHAKMKEMSGLCRPEEKITLTHDQMHKIFVHLKRAIAQILMDYAGKFPGAPDISGITGVAIS
jgi:hypothetical protein